MIDDMLINIMEYTGRTEEELLAMPFSSILELQAEMEKVKSEDAKRAVLADSRYAGMLKKWMSGYDFLRQWFTDEKIITAASDAKITERDIVEEFPAPVDRVSINNPERIGYEFLRRSYENVPAYDKNGRRYMDTEYKLCNVYRRRNQFQGLARGEILQKLIDTNLPHLAPFGIKCYDFDNQLPEVYPRCNLYTPLVALFTGDAEAVLKRIRDYAKWYNHGDYTPEKIEAIIASEEGQAYLQAVREVPARLMAA